MKEDFLVITSKDFQCPKCQQDVPHVQRAQWLQMICEQLQYNNDIRIRVTKRNMPHAELPMSILKEAFMLEEEYRQEVQTKSKVNGKVIHAIEIKLIKVPAIRR
jgi:hypothetical protein